MDPVTIASLIAILTLLIERGFSIVRRVKKSTCCGSSIEFEEDKEKK